jgi:hypothetical protein
MPAILVGRYDLMSMRLLVCWFFALLPAYSGELTGTVTDSATGAPLSHAVVSVDGIDTVISTTDSLGRFQFTWPEPVVGVLPSAVKVAGIQLEKNALIVPLTQPGSIEISLHDVGGRRQFHSSRTHAGGRLVFPLPALSDGVYQLSVQAGSPAILKLALVGGAWLLSAPAFPGDAPARAAAKAAVAEPVAGHFLLVVKPGYAQKQVQADMLTGSLSISLRSTGHAGLRDTVHSIVLFRRDEAGFGVTSFQGFQLEAGKQLVICIKSYTQIIGNLEVPKF